MSDGPEIVPDKKYPGIFRIQYKDGSLSDMLNWDRAREVLRLLKQKKTEGET